MKIKTYGNYLDCLLTIEDVGASSYIGEINVTDREYKIIKKGLSGFLEAQTLLDKKLTKSAQGS
jgi:5-bromo-4-chloroindolyl phosphate hydrolysis protein